MSVHEYDQEEARLRDLLRDEPPKGVKDRIERRLTFRWYLGALRRQLDAGEELDTDAAMLYAIARLAFLMGVGTTLIVVGAALGTLAWIVGMTELFGVLVGVGIAVIYLSIITIGVRKVGNLILARRKDRKAKEEAS